MSAVEERPRRRGNNQGRHADLPRYDQELRAAKNAGKHVTFVLACETPYTDSDCRVTGEVLEVDKYDIKLRLLRPIAEVWFKKLAIVTTEVIG